MDTKNGFKDSDYCKEYFAVHNCTLPPETDIIVSYIDSGMFVNTRRKLRSLLTVNEDSQITRTYLRSRARVRQEKLRHLQNHYYMIHPFSEARACWEMFMAFVFFALLVIIPISNVFKYAVYSVNVARVAFNSLCIVDIFITFVSGYYDSANRKIVLNARVVARHYLRGYFIIDLYSSIPFELIFIIFNIDPQDRIWMLYLARYLKLLRLATLIKYLDRLRSRRGYSIYRFRTFKLLVVFVIGLFWSTMQIYIINHERGVAQSNVYRELLSSCFIAIYKFLLIGYEHNDQEVNVKKVFFSILVLFLGVVFKLYIYAETLQLLNRNLSSSNNYQQMLQQLTEYVRYKQLPDSMRKRIYMYFEYRFENNYYKESDIMEILSENLREEMVLNSCQRLVESVEFFHDIPQNLLLRIVKCMRSEIYLTNDVIVRAGFAGDTMYFIASGTIAVYTSGGKEICHLCDGAHFGEIAVLMNSDQRVASVIAIECCELYALNRKDFRQAISPYPEFANRIKKLAQMRLQHTMKYMTEEKLLDSRNAPE